MRGETFLITFTLHFDIFQSTPLMRGETRVYCVGLEWLHISIHSPHARGDVSTTPSFITRFTFQSTPLMRGETNGDGQEITIRTISIHSPHARGDNGDGQEITIRTISIHSPHARGDMGVDGPVPSPTFTFQSTPLMRGETTAVLIRYVPAANFNPLPSCEGRLHVGFSLILP